MPTLHHHLAGILTESASSKSFCIKRVCMVKSWFRGSRVALFRFLYAFLFRISASFSTGSGEMVHKTFLKRYAFHPSIWLSPGTPRTYSTVLPRQRVHVFPFIYRNKNFLPDLFRLEISLAQVSLYTFWGQKESKTFFHFHQCASKAHFACFGYA